jgi:hypothetical protein
MSEKAQTRPSEHCRDTSASPQEAKFSHAILRRRRSAKGGHAKGRPKLLCTRSLKNWVAVQKRIDVFRSASDKSTPCHRGSARLRRTERIHCH